MATTKKKLVVYLPAEQADKLEEIATTEDRTITGLIRLAITAFLESRPAT